MAVKSLAQSSLVEPFSTNSMLAGYSGNAFHHLETVRLSSNASTVEFTNLARYSDFQHLQIRSVFRTNRGGYTATYWGMRFNSDTGANYSWHWLNGGYSGSVPASSGVANASAIRTSWAPGATASASLFASCVTDILDPFETNKNTTIRSLFGKTENEQMVGLGSGAWNNTAALTSTLIFDELGAQFVAGSRFSLYGIRARA